MKLSEATDYVRTQMEDMSISDEKLRRHIKQVETDILSRHDWPWLMRQHTIVTAPPVAISGVYLSNGSNVGSLSSSTTHPLIGHLIRADEEYYRVIRIQSITIYLDRPFTGTSGTYEVNIVTDTYALPTGALNVKAIRLSGDLCEGYELELSEGEPQYWTTGTLDYLPAAPPPNVTSSPPGTLHDIEYRYQYVDPYSGATGPYSDITAITCGDGTVVLDFPTGMRVPGLNVRVWRRDTQDNPFRYVADIRATLPSWGDNSVNILLGPTAPVLGSGVGITLTPIPDDSYTLQVQYTAGWTRSLDDDAELMIPEQFLPVLMDGVMQSVLLAYREDGRAAAMGQHYELAINRMIQRSRPSTVIGYIGG